MSECEWWNGWGVSSHLPPLEAPVSSRFRGDVDSTGVPRFHGPGTALDRNHSWAHAVLTGLWMCWLWLSLYRKLLHRIGKGSPVSADGSQTSSLSWRWQGEGLEGGQLQAAGGSAFLRKARPGRGMDTGSCRVWPASITLHLFLLLSICPPWPEEARPCQNRMKLEAIIRQFHM